MEKALLMAALLSILLYRYSGAAEPEPERVDAEMLLDLDLLFDDDFDRHRAAEHARMLEELDRLDQEEGSDARGGEGDPR